MTAGARAKTKENENEKMDTGYCGVDIVRLTKENDSCCCCCSKSYFD